MVRTGRYALGRFNLRLLIAFLSWAVIFLAAVVDVKGQGVSAKEPWQTAWEKVVKAAKQEGKVVVLGPPGAPARRALTEHFEKTFPEIQVEYTGASGARIAPKLLAERRAGRYLADITIGGVGTPMTSFMPAGALDPVKPVLILPDVIDPRKWWQGKIEFADQAENYVLVFATNVRTHVVINPTLVNARELRSYRDLLDPKWRGKIVMHDPTTRGQGEGTAKYWYLHPDLGKDFVRKFFAEQRVNFSRDSRQMLEWVARGQYPIHVAPSDLMVTEFKTKGLPIEPLRADHFKETAELNVGFSSVSLINRAANPNAARVYLNWLLSKEAQSEWAKNSGYPSRRLDASREGLDPDVLPQDGKSYLAHYKEEYFRFNDEVQAFLNEILELMKTTR